MQEMKDCIERVNFLKEQEEAEKKLLNKMRVSLDTEMMIATGLRIENATKPVFRHGPTKAQRLAKERQERARIMAQRARKRLTKA